MPSEQKIIVIPDGKICDYIDGKFRNDTPEEYVRQTIEKRLVNEHKYLPEQIRIEYTLQVGSNKPRADIVIWEKGADQTQGIRLDEDERAALEKGLQASGLPLSAYLRKLILGESIQAAPSEELRRLRTEIHQIGNNINQLSRKANAGFASRDEVTRALRMLDRVYELMYEFSK